MPIHVKMGDPAYGGHAIGKRTLNLIIHWLRRSPIGMVNGRTLVRYWNTSVAQWRLAWRPRRGRIRRVSLIGVVKIDLDTSLSYQSIKQIKSDQKSSPPELNQSFPRKWDAINVNVLICTLLLLSVLVCHCIRFDWHNARIIKCIWPFARCQTCLEK